MLGQNSPPHKNDSETSPFRLFHSPAFAPPAELKQASKMLGWEIPSPLEENPTHTYASDVNEFAEISSLEANFLSLAGKFFSLLKNLSILGVKF